MIEKLFFLGMIFIPFTCIAGLPGMGELKHEASFYLFILALALSVFPVLTRFSFVTGQRDREKIYLLPMLMAVVFAVIGLSFGGNFLTIKDSVFMGRTGLEKFATANVLMIYGFALSAMTYFIAARQSWDKLVIKPLAISVALCGAFSLLEMAGKVNGGIGAFFAVVSKPVYGAAIFPEWDMRLRSVGFEPPDFANSMCYMWPWILAGVINTKGTNKLVFSLVFLVLNVMIYLTESRTSLVILSGLLAIFMGLKLLFLHHKAERDPEKMALPVTLGFLLIIPVLVWMFSLHYDQLVNTVVSGDNISNLSRLASITAAFRMFHEHPFFGFGFGQFGFHVTSFMPSWGFYSYEIREWLFGASNTYWPSTYSVYARFAADMGVGGILMWLGIWLFLARSLLVETLRYWHRTQEIPFAAFPLILSCFCVLLAGIPNDSVRAPMIWINMGLACRYLYTLRKDRLRA